MFVCCCRDLMLPTTQFLQKMADDMEQASPQQHIICLFCKSCIFGNMNVLHAAKAY